MQFDSSLWSHADSDPRIDHLGIKPTEFQTLTVE